MARQSVRGIAVRHERSCPVKGWEHCKCNKAYQANVWSKRDERRIRKTFPTLAAAERWRADQIRGLQDGTVRAPTQVTVRKAGEALIAGMKDGSIRDRSGKRYKPSTIRSYEASLKRHVYPDYGARRLSSVEYHELQELVDSMAGDGLDGQTIRNAITPLRVLYKRHRREIPVNPTRDLELPARGNKPRRIAAPDLAARMLDALTPADRAIWATVFYGGGLRSGELQALRVEDIELFPEGRWGLLHVRKAWDKVEGSQGPKSAAGVRTAPIPEQLYTILEKHLLNLGRNHGLVFGRSAELPFSYNALRDRTATAWKRAGISPPDLLGHDPEIHKADSHLQLHEARHTCKSLLAAASIPRDRRDRYLGHADHSVGGRYEHQLDASYLDDAKAFSAYLARAVSPTRLEVPIRAWREPVEALQAVETDEVVT